MSLYSKPTKMAVRILAQMASEETDRLQTGKEIADGAQIPIPSAAKVLQALVKHGIVVSRKGPGGGFRLELPPAEIRLAQVVAAVEAHGYDAECLGGLGRCTGRGECSLHRNWMPVKEKMAEFLEMTSLADIIEVSGQIVEFVET